MDHYDDNRAKEAERQAKWMKEFSQGKKKKKPITISSQLVLLVFIGLIVMSVLNWVGIT